MPVEVLRSWIAGRARERGDVTEVALLAFPVVLQTIAETAMQLIDSAMVGRIGAAQLGAIGFAGIWLWTLYVPFTGTATGVQVFVSRHHGAGEPEKCGPWVWQAFGTIVPAMVLWMLGVAWLLPLLFDRIMTPGTMHDAAIAYSYPRLLGGPAVVANLAMMSFFRGLGDTRTPMRAVLIGVAVNVTAGMGPDLRSARRAAARRRGCGLCAYRPAAGRSPSCCCARFCDREMRARHHTGPRWPDRAAFARFLRTSAPIGGQWLLDMTTFAVFTSIVARMGEASMAASQAMLQLLSMSFMQALAIATASGALVGRYLGAGDIEAAQRSYRSAQLLALGVCAVVAMLFVTIPEQLLSIFSDDRACVRWRVRCSRSARCSRSSMRWHRRLRIAARRGRHALAVRGAGSLAWLLRLPVVYVSAVVLHGGVFGAWAGELVYVIALGIAFALRFHTGEWCKVGV